MVTWDLLITADSRFADLLTRAGEVRDDGMALEFCATDVWYGRDGSAGFARPLRALLADNGIGLERVEGRDAYRAATVRIYGALPGCRHD